MKRRSWTGFFEALARKSSTGPDQTTVQNVTQSGGGLRQIVFSIPSETLETGDDKTVHYLLDIGENALWEPLSVAAHLTTAPVGAALQLDVRLFDENGAEQGSILDSPPLAVSDGATDARTTAVSALRGVHLGHLVLDIDQVGSSTAGGRLEVVVIGRDV